jgi:translation initiation factor IF-1
MTVATKILLSLGWNARLQFPHNPWNQRKTMQSVVDKFARVFGACAILVSLCSGCASGVPSAGPMHAAELNYFQVDCRIANQQRAMLESMRPTPEEIVLNKLNPFADKHGDVTTQINRNLFLLKYCNQP